MNVLPSKSTIFALQVLVLLYHFAVAAGAPTGRSSNDTHHENIKPPPPPPQPSDAVDAALHGAVGLDNRCDRTAAAVIEHTQQICSGPLIDEALRSVHLEPQEADAMVSVLSGLGFRTALDLQLLAGQPEVEELMLALKQHDLPIGDRAKVRLLIGDHAHRDRLFSARSFAKTMGSVPSTPTGSAMDDRKEPTRVLQETSGTSSGTSMDTIAIVLSVLVGAAGYFVQGVPTDLPGARMFSAAQSTGLSCIIAMKIACVCHFSIYIASGGAYRSQASTRDAYLRDDAAKGA
jgi:hypothetical protein